MLETEFENDFYVSRMFSASTNTELFDYYQSAILNGEFWQYLLNMNTGNMVKELLIQDIIGIDIELKEDFSFKVKVRLKNQEAFDDYFSKNRGIPKNIFDDRLREELLEIVASLIGSALTIWEKNNIQYRPVDGVVYWWERVIHTKGDEHGKSWQTCE